MSADGEVSLKDVYDLVGESRKELSTQIEKVNGDVTDIKVQVGQVETKLDNHTTRIVQVEKDVRKLSEKVNAMRLRAAELGGLAGVGVNVILRALEWLLLQVGQ